jgi:UDP-N-acetylmuramoyl-tripeptide--D-alanyl-D-alanine ligase
MRFTFDELVRATGGQPAGEPPRTPARIVTDTRSIAPGDAFVALRGERFDGADFVGDAFAKGAALAVVPRADALPRGAPGIVVADTLRAYMALAAAARWRSRANFIGITGSTGKTTTKALLAQLLSLAGWRMAATPQNENNEIGVSKLLLGLEGNEEVVVVEMGCRHEGEIAELAAIARPQIGILTNVGDAHLELFGTRERIAETKWGLFAHGAAAILNAADEASRLRADRLRNAVRWFAAGAAAREPTPLPAALIPDPQTLIFADAEGREVQAIATALPGEHNLANLAAAVAAARAIGTSARAVVAAIPALVLPPGRYERVALPGGAHLVYDAYNASLAGTLATLRAFASEAAARRIAVLGGMAELGADSAQMHAQIGAAVPACKIDLLLAGGAYADATVRGALEAGMPERAVVAYRENAAAAGWLREHLREGDAILLKGSRMYKMEEILEALRDGKVDAHAHHS